MIQSIEHTVHRFNREVQVASKGLIERDLVKFHKKLSFEALRGIAQLTPVRTGRARANWQTTNREPAASEVPWSSEVELSEGIVEKTILSQVMAEGITAIEKIVPFTVLWITNNLDYILPLEYGSSEQNSREGMVRKTLNRLSNFHER